MRNDPGNLVLIGFPYGALGDLADQIEHLVPPLCGSDDPVWIGGPDEGLGLVVVLLDEAVDGSLEVDDATAHRSDWNGPAAQGIPARTLLSDLTH